jgi:hypothetical protein
VAKVVGRRTAYLHRWEAIPCLEFRGSGHRHVRS